MLLVWSEGKTRVLLTLSKARKVRHKQELPRANVDRTEETRQRVRAAAPGGDTGGGRDARGSCLALLGQNPGPAALPVWPQANCFPLSLSFFLHNGIFLFAPRGPVPGSACDSPVQVRVALKKH